MKTQIQQDRTDRNATLDQLLRENTRLRGDLLTVAIRISHDLRTPLGGVVSTGELLKDILTEKDPASAALTDSLFTSVDEMNKLIGQIRFITRASAEPKAKERIEMGTVVSAVLQRLENRILKKHAKVIEPASWPEVNGVADWLEFIWWNFVMNALQHGGDKPKIQLGWQKKKNGIQFQISDNGGGVPSEIRPQLFQPFNSLHKPEGGRGLGLSGVQRLVELQGGECGYETAAGGGALFYFTLPA